jgi:arsenite methyltransferase
VSPLPPDAPEPAVQACCAVLYGDPIVELLAGESLHPGGLGSSRRLLTVAHLARGDTLLDAGCGLGASARLAALEFGLEVDACDVSSEAIGRARVLAHAAGAGIRFSEASVLDLPYPAASFRAVLSECVLSTTSKVEALREMRRVTASGGRLLVSDVVTRSPVSAPDPLARVLCLSEAWRPGELRDAVTTAGFRVEDSWDETEGVARLVDRVEARVELVRTIARDQERSMSRGTSGGRLEGSAARIGLLRSIADAALVFEEARRMVRAGTIRYEALVARAPGRVPS